MIDTSLFEGKPSASRQLIPSRTTRSSLPGRMTWILPGATVTPGAPVGAARTEKVLRETTERVARRWAEVPFFGAFEKKMTVVGFVRFWIMEWNHGAGRIDIATGETGSAPG
jgi:hypothetical protein